MPTIEQAVKALNGGNRDEARQILTMVLAGDTRNVDALLWMAAASDTADERRKCLLRVLEIDSSNRHALKGLEALGPIAEGPIAEKPIADEPAHATPQEPTFTPVKLSTPKVRRSNTNTIAVVAVVGLGILMGTVYSGLVLRLTAKPDTIVESTLPPRPIPTERKTPTPDPYPMLASLESYPWVNELDLVKRPDYFKTKPVCLDEMVVYDVREDQGTTTFSIRSNSGNDTAIGTVYYAGTIPDLTDNFKIIIGGYVVGSESEVGVAAASRSVIFMQRYHTISSNGQFHASTIGDETSYKCKYMEPNALIGHWLSEDGRVQYFIDQERIIMVADGKQSTLKYSVLDTNNRENSITISTLSDKTESKQGHDKYLVFAPDRKSFIDTARVPGRELSGAATRFNYIDSKTSP